MANAPHSIPSDSKRSPGLPGFSIVSSRVRVHCAVGQDAKRSTGEAVWLSEG
jgi:hypothetical protein